MGKHKRYLERRERQEEFKEDKTYYKKIGGFSGIAVVAAVIITLKVLGVF